MSQCFISTVLRETFMFCFAGILNNMPPNNAACLKCWMSRNIRAFSFFLTHPTPPVPLLYIYPFPPLHHSVCIFVCFALQLPLYLQISSLNKGHGHAQCTNKHIHMHTHRPKHTHRHASKRDIVTHTVAQK